jgi:hypothetical protein
MHFAGVPVSFGDVLGMALRGTLKRELVSAMIVTQKAELGISTNTLEAHYLAGGRPDEVVRAVVQLARLGQNVDVALLCAIDLTSRDLPALLAAYVRVRELHPNFAFDEFVTRHLGGEDVIGASTRGTLAPLARQSGWQIRIEYGPINTEEIKKLFSRIASDAVVTVKRPGSGEWEPVDRVRALLER